jgi:RHH-type proline utilization regulon transcriptional repressor/proline dehydrogenase/delta 1-pyrroline-5-carboxylate dehydrogenase
VSVVKANFPLPGSNKLDIEPAVRQWGEKVLEFVEAAEAPSLFSRKGFYGTLMEWAMRDEHFKTQLFRFVDVLPMLNSSREVARHLQEYLGDDSVKLSPALRLGLKAAGGASWLFGGGIKTQVTDMARQFMLGNEPKEIVATLRAFNRQDVAFTVDVLGEAVVSEQEADAYAQRYLDLMELLGREIPKWQQVSKSNESPQGRLPALNLSVKVSALYSQIHPADPEIARKRISDRLRPLLRRAKELGAFINLDMESYGLKELTLELFKTIFAEAEFKESPPCGLAVQAYLKESEGDLRGLIDWARKQGRRPTIRLVKGAYWDYETLIGQQRHWPVPVFSRKAETDANFEKLSLLLLENRDALGAAFGTHNVRSIAFVLAQADRLGVGRREFEFQMLYGMAEPIKRAVMQLGCRLREYCPVGELLPGMAYLVRRLLENTSNEGFLANKFAKGASREELLSAPSPASPGQVSALEGDGELVSPSNERMGLGPTPSMSGRRQSPSGDSVFHNEPHTDFNRTEEREKMRTALQNVRRALGQRHPLVLNHKPVPTQEWLPSLNPANQQEVIGFAAQATIAEAETALNAARAAQPKWGRTTAAERAALLEKVAMLMRRDKAALCALEVLEAGKQWSEADADVAEAIDFCNFYAVVMRELAQPHRTQVVAGESNVQYWWPRGTGVVISPWNFPLAILSGMASAALVAGNAIVIKPSDQTPVIGARLMDLFIEAGLPPGVVNLLTGPGGNVGAHLVAHPQVDFIAFTGSKEVGLKIWKVAGNAGAGQANLKKVVCEMGGKNCLIVDGDADLDEAVTGSLSSAFGYQGQKCSALSRLIVLADNYGKFMERLTAAAASMRVGPAETPGTVLGPVISREAQQRILEVIEQGKTEAKLAWQGSVPGDPNACYVPPTIFTEVPATSRLFREEIFGPVLAVSEAKDFDEALRLANESEFALTGGCYSRSPVNIERVKAELVCGNLYLNRPITGAIVERQPFGGFKMSGGGTKAGGREYLQNFLVPRVITENCMRRGFAPMDESQV